MRRMRTIGCKRIAAVAVGLASAVVLASPAGALAAGAMIEFPIPTANAQPDDIVAGGDGSLWFTESHTSTIGRISPSGTIREFAFTGSVPSQLGLAQDGSVFFGDRANNTHRVGRIKPLGAVKFFSVPSADSFPGGLEAGPDGNLWIAEGFSPAKVGHLDPGGFG